MASNSATLEKLDRLKAMAKSKPGTSGFSRADLAAIQMAVDSIESPIADAPQDVIDAAKEIAIASLNTIRNIIAEEFPDADLDVQKDFVKAVCQFMVARS